MESEVAEQRRVLVVDDNVDNAQTTAMFLSILGHEVVTADNGRTALETAKSFHPDAILLDIGLPEMDGYQVAAKLREDDCCSKSLIIAVSGYGQDSDIKRSLGSGFDKHLTKPVDLDALATLISRGREAAAV